MRVLEANGKEDEEEKSRKETIQSVNGIIKSKEYRRGYIKEREE